MSELIHFALLLKGDTQAAVAASKTLIAHKEYDRRQLVSLMEDAGPVFSYAHNFLQRAVTSGLDVSADLEFSIHSNVGIKLLQYGADKLGLEHFKKAARLNPSNAGMQVRVSLVTLPHGVVAHWLP